MVFLGDIAFYMATLVFAVGVWMIHHSKHHDTGKECRLLKTGGYIVTVISILGMLCTGYYWMKYYSQDAYKKPFPHHEMMSMNGMMGKGGMMGMMKMMGKGNMMGNMDGCMSQMQGKMMDSEMMAKMKGCMMQGMGNMNDGDKEMSKEEHESHH